MGYKRMDVLDTITIKCSLYRGGTSRGLMFAAKDIPVEEEMREYIFKRGIDCWNASQVDGVGGSTSSTSKICVVEPSKRPGIDVDWTFYQVGVADEVVDSKGSCGNMMAAVGAFAIDEGMVMVEDDADMADIIVFNTNISQTLRMKIPLIGKKTRTKGNYHMAGVQQSGAKLNISIVRPGGENTGSVNPIGNRTAVIYEGKKFEVTFSDVVNAFVFIQGKDLGLQGNESSKEIQDNAELLNTINGLRDLCAVESGISQNLEEAIHVKQNNPKAAIIFPPIDYITSDGQLVMANQVDMVVKAVSMRKLHKNCPASGLYNLAVSAVNPETIPGKICPHINKKPYAVVRIGHPGGVVAINIAYDADANSVTEIGVDRTARKIMKGELYIPAK